MADLKQADPRKHTTPVRPRSRGLRAVKELFIRLWALAILMAVVAIAWFSMEYLVDYVFSPVEVPPRILTWQSKLDPQMLSADAPAEIKTETPRAPMGHYHGVDEWFETASFLSCTISGCHSPLPHQKRREIRAFANLHATFMTCQTCHEKGAAPGMETVWLEPVTARARKDPPAMLQLLNLIVDVDQFEATQAFTDNVINLLDLAIGQTRDEPLLEHLNLRLKTTHPGSPVWVRAMRDLQRELPQHARGEYGARLAPAAGGRDYAKFHQEIRELAGRYFTEQSETGRERIEEEIHEGVDPQPAGCLACHGAEPARMDFVKAGYTPQRAQSLRDVEIARVMDGILKGQPFHLPSIILPGGAPSNGTLE